MTTFPYQIGLIGNYAPHLTAISRTIEKLFADLGYTNADFAVLEQEKIVDRQKKSPFAAMYFGSMGYASTDEKLLKEIIQESLVILPIVDTLNQYAKQVPPSLAGINGVERDTSDELFVRDVSTLLEGFRLLRSERRLFISYRRDDSRSIAQQLYEELDRRRFDVFLDTNGVPPGRDFQSTLWHRLADSDVVVLLDGNAQLL